MNPNHAQFADLDEAEVEAIDNSMRKDELSRRTRGIVLSSLVVAGGVVIFLTYGFGPIFLALLTLGTLIVSVAEKITYQRRMLHYESVIRKLLTRVRMDSTPSAEELAKYRETPTVPPPARVALPRDHIQDNGSSPHDSTEDNNARFNGAQYDAQYDAQHGSGQPTQYAQRTASSTPDRSSGSHPSGHGFDSDWSDDARIARHASAK